MLKCLSPKTLANNLILICRQRNVTIENSQHHEPYPLERLSPSKSRNEKWWGTAFVRKVSGLGDLIYGTEIACMKLRMKSLLNL